MSQSKDAVTIRIKRNDQFHGKTLHKILIEFLMNAKNSGTTVWTGVDGFGKRRRSTIHLEEITINGATYQKIQNYQVTIS